MQNIFLEKIESFEGILIATTNLVESLDKAFDRRFLYKIKFPNPNLEVRKTIWKENLPMLNDNLITKISKPQLSGGSIVKIVKQYLVAKAVKAIKKDSDILDLINGALTSNDKILGFLK